jgi:hypothetical protein
VKSAELQDDETAVLMTLLKKKVTSKSAVLQNNEAADLILWLLSYFEVGSTLRWRNGIVLVTSNSGIYMDFGAHFFLEDSTTFESQGT